MRDLYDRLKERGFDPSYLRSFVLPEWWTDDMADTESNRALAEAFIAKQLGFSVQELRNPTRPLTPPSLTQFRFKRYKGQVDEKVRASALVAQRAAQASLRAIGDRLPPFHGPRAALAIREEILRQSQYVDLDSLLRVCWASGIPVIRLAQVPAQGKRFDGMATFVGDRPLIVLASGRDAPPWLAFHLAHELGHVMLGHVRPGGSGLIDYRLETETGSSSEERASDRFACERFADGRDGPCNTPDIRLRFWRDVLTSLKLSTDLLFAKARDNNNRIQEQALTTPELREDWIEDLEARITAWRRDHNDDR